MVVDGVQLARLEKLAARLIAHEGVLFPRIPQPFHHGEIFIGDAVAQRMFRMLLAGKVFRRAFQGRGHHVPARAAAAQMIEAGELARGNKGLAVGGGYRAHQPEMFGNARQRRQQRQRLEAVQKMGDRFFIDIEAVGDEQEVELALFRFARDAFRIVEADAGVRLRGGMAPCGHIAGGAMQDGAQSKLSRGHDVLSSFVAAVQLARRIGTRERRSVQGIRSGWRRNIAR